MDPPIGPASPGDVIAERYRIESWLGQGNMAVVYRATHFMTGQACALKLVHAHLVERPEIRDMFIREARIGSLIGNNPHIVTVFDAGFDPSRGTPFLAMELLDGEPLDRYVKKHGPMPASLLRTLFLQLGDALTQAHAAGVIHRDLKPGNLFLTFDRKREPVLKIVDFGIAKLMEEGVQHTATQVGSPAYAAPEQLGQAIRPMALQMGIVISPNVSPQTDIWALGVIAYELLLGVAPGHLWTGAEHGTVADLMMGVALRPTPVVALRAGANSHRFPHGFDQWLDRCLRKNAAERWPSAEQAVEALAEMLSGGDDEAETRQIQPRAMLEAIAKEAPNATVPLPHRPQPASPAPAPSPAASPMNVAPPAPVETVLLPPNPSPAPRRASLPALESAAPDKGMLKTLPITAAFKVDSPPVQTPVHTPSTIHPLPTPIPPAASTTRGLAGTQPPPESASSRRWMLPLAGLGLAVAIAIAVTILSPAKGGLKIIVSGGNERVAISIDGNVKCGLTPCLVSDLSPGEHEVRATSEGKRQVTDRVTVKGGEERVLHLSLEENSTPPAAPSSTAIPNPAPPPSEEVKQAEEVEREKPSVPEPVPAPSIPPSQPSSTPITVAPPKPTASGAANMALLNINSIPVSKVLLDGRAIGGTPKVGVSVSPGTHTVTFIHSTKGKQTVTVTVKAGETKVAAVKFK